MTEEPRMNDHADTLRKFLAHPNVMLDPPEEAALDAAIAALEAGRRGEADELLRDWGLDPERFRSEGGHLNPGKIRAALLHPGDYDELYLSGWSYFKPPFRVVERGETIYVEDSGSMRVMLQWPQHPAEETDLAERETWRLGEAFVNAANAAAPQQPPPDRPKTLREVVGDLREGVTIQTDAATLLGWRNGSATDPNGQPPPVGVTDEMVAWAFYRSASDADIAAMCHALELASHQQEAAPSVSEAVDAMAWRLLRHPHLRDVLTRAAESEDGSATGCLRRLDLILSRAKPAPVSEPAASGEGLLELIDRYWELAYAEGREGRTHDTPNGDAQITRSKIDALIRRLASGQGDDLPTQEEVDLRDALDKAERALAGCEKDAARYRFLRDRCNRAPHPHTAIQFSSKYMPNTAIDAAMTELREALAPFGQQQEATR